MLKRDILLGLYNDKTTLEELKQYMFAYVTDTAAQKVMKREDTSHIADAYDLIVEAFNNLDSLFENKPVINNDSPR